MTSAPIILTASRLAGGNATVPRAAAAALFVVSRRGLSSLSPEPALAFAASAPQIHQRPLPPSTAPPSSPQQPQQQRRRPLSPTTCASATTAATASPPTPKKRPQLHPEARNVLLNLRGLKKRQAARFGPPKPNLAGGRTNGSVHGNNNQRNTLAFGRAFGGRPPNGAPVRHQNGAGSGLHGFNGSLVQGGAKPPASLLQGRPSPGLAQGRPHQANGAAPSLIQGPPRKPSLAQARPVVNTVNGVNGVNGNHGPLNGQTTVNGVNGGHHRLNGAGGPAYTTSQEQGKHEEVSPGAREYESDLIVVLDMDECLIHSQFLSHQQSSCSTTLSAPLEDKYRQAEAGRPSNSPAFDADEEAESIVSSNCEYFRLRLPDGDLVHVNKRPGLMDFLTEVCAKYETHVFTAAVDAYADPLLDRLDPAGDMFSRRFFRESCTLDSDLGAYVKDLHALLGGRDPWGRGARSIQEPHVNGFDPRATQREKEQAKKELFEKYDEGRVVLVDNNPLSFLAQPSNGILVSNFYDDPKDATLEAVTELLDELDRSGDDVRPVLDERFGLAEALGDVLKYSDGGWR